MKKMLVNSAKAHLVLSNNIEGHGRPAVSPPPHLTCCFSLSPFTATLPTSLLSSLSIIPNRLMTAHSLVNMCCLSAR